METQRFQLNILQQFLSEVHHSSARTLMGTHRSPRSSWLTRPVGLEGVTEVAHQTLTMGGSGDQTPADEFTEYWAPDIIMNDYKYIKLYTCTHILYMSVFYIHRVNRYDTKKICATTGSWTAKLPLKAVHINRWREVFNSSSQFCLSLKSLEFPAWKNSSVWAHQLDQ